jgi:hypothetical protein
MNKQKAEQKNELIFLLILGALLLPLILFVLSHRNVTGSAFAQPFDSVSQGNFALYAIIIFILIVVVLGAAYIKHQENKIVRIFKRERIADSNNLPEEGTDPALAEYIKIAFEKGYSNEELTNYLLDSGWDKQSIDAAFNSIKK